MLNIPTLIQDLYKADGIWKNFRAELVDGSAAPITNQDIVRESLKFEESCCSESVFRFGGCERSKIEFETVGIGNILGQLLRCSIEIDVSSLTGAQLATIVADPGDGVLVAPAQSDIGRGYYRIPLGVFRVSRCPRDHQATAHRQITALSPRYWRLSPIEEAKLLWYSGQNPLNIFPIRFMLANVGYYAPGFMESMGWTKAQAAGWSYFSAASAISDSGIYYTVDGEERRFRVSGTYRTYEVMTVGVQTSVGDILGISLGDFDAAGLTEFINDWMNDVDWPTSDMSYGPVQIRGTGDFLRYILGPDTHAAPYVQRYDTAPFWLQAAVLTGDVEVWDTAGVAPYYDGRAIPNARAGGSWILSIPVSVTIELLDEDDNVIADFSTGVGSETPVIWKWSNSDPDTLPALTLTPPVTDTTTWTDTSGNVTTWRSWLGIDAEKIIRGWAELNGAELLTGRGVPKLARLNQLSPEAIGPGHYSSVWWEEYLTEPVGSVAYVFGKDHDQAGVMSLGSGGSVYDLSDNGVLALAPAAGRAEIEDMIYHRMSDGLAELDSYSPAEVEMPAWPWLEAGDALEITAADGETVNTYIMQRVISGVQLLWDEIDAPGGEVESDED